MTRVNLNDLKDAIAMKLYGMKRSDALLKCVCVSCKEPAKFYSEAGKSEYQKSALCEKCFDEIFKDENA